MTKQRFAGWLVADAGEKAAVELELDGADVVLRSETGDIRRIPCPNVAVSAVASPRFQLLVDNDPVVFEAASPSAFMFDFLASLRDQKATFAALPDRSERTVSDHPEPGESAAAGASAPSRPVGASRARRIPDDAGNHNLSDDTDRSGRADPPTRLDSDPSDSAPVVAVLEEPDLVIDIRGPERSTVAGETEESAKPATLTEAVRRYQMEHDASPSATAVSPIELDDATADAPAEHPAAHQDLETSNAPPDEVDPGDTGRQSPEVGRPRIQDAAPMGSPTDGDVADGPSDPLQGDIPAEASTAVVEDDTDGGAALDTQIEVGQDPAAAVEAGDVAVTGATPVEPPDEEFVADAPVISPAEPTSTGPAATEPTTDRTTDEAEDDADTTDVTAPDAEHRPPRLTLSEAIARANAGSAPIEHDASEPPPSDPIDSGAEAAPEIRLRDPWDSITPRMHQRTSSDGREASFAAERHRGIGDRVKSAHAESSTTSTPEVDPEPETAPVDVPADPAADAGATGLVGRLRSLVRRPDRGSPPDEARQCEHEWEDSATRSGRATRYCTKCSEISIEPIADAGSPGRGADAPGTTDAPQAVPSPTRPRRARSELLREAAARRNAFRSGDRNRTP